MTKKILLTTLILFSFLGSLNVYAYEITSTDDLTVDNSIVKEDVNYSTPSTIVIVPLFPTTNDQDVTDVEWYKGIYYYSIERLGYSDIPFHYIVSKTGSVFEGNKGGEERKINVRDLGSNVILIGYLADKFSSEFDLRSKNTLNELVLDVANRNSINSANIQISGIKFVRDEGTRSVFMQKEDVFGSWGAELRTIQDYVSAHYKPVAKEYSAEVLSIDLPSEEVEPGTTISGQITLKNNGSYGLYSGSNSELIASKTNNNPSIFFLNNEWLSQTQFAIMAEDTGLLPKQEATFDFTITAPLYFGERTETFTLKTTGGQQIDTNEFTLKLTMKRTDKRIVEIKETELGYLRVRSDASTVAPEVARASTGQRFFVLEDAGNGFVKIDLGNGQSGWVAIWYLTFI